MGASKTCQYSINEITTAKIARALAHPARVRILSLLKQNVVIRNTDLVKDLQLVKSTINAHLTIMKEADLILLDFHSNSYWIRCNNEILDNIPFNFIEMD